MYCKETVWWHSSIRYQYKYGVQRQCRWAYWSTLETPTTLHLTNNAGERFASHLAVNNLIALNTFFRQRQYATWMHPRSKLLHQIDHFITTSEDFCRFTDAGLTVSLIDSDHKAIGCKLRIMTRLKKRIPQRQRLLRIDYDSLRDEGMKKVFCEKVAASYATQFQIHYIRASPPR